MSSRVGPLLLFRRDLLTVERNAQSVLDRIRERIFYSKRNLNYPRYKREQMIHTYKENQDWWDRLSNTSKVEIFDRIEEVNPEFAESLDEQWKAGKKLSEKQLSALRKWDK